MVEPGAGERSDPRWAADEALTELYAAHWDSAWSGWPGCCCATSTRPRRSSRTPSSPCTALARLREPESALAYLRRAVVNGCRSVLRHRGVEQRYLVSETPRAPRTA